MIQEMTEEEKMKYKDDPNYVVQEVDGELFVAPKFTDEDWNKMETMIDKHPLFAKDLSDVENNEFLSALQAIKYDEESEVTLERLYVG